MTHNSKENLLFTIILCIMLVIGGKELWAFDRHAKPTFVATWTLDKTAPEYNALPKGNPTLSYRPHKIHNCGFMKTSARLPYTVRAQISSLSLRQKMCKRHTSSGRI